VTAALFGKRVLSSAAHSLGLTGRKLESMGKGAFLILMYHRVTDHSVARGLGHEGMYVGKETFDQQLRFLKSRFQVIPLEEGLEFLERKPGENGSGRKPLCAITFDDGWRDVYENAYPLLVKHEVPATVFLPTGYIGTNRRFWPDRLASIVNKKASETFEEPLLSLPETDFHIPQLPESASDPKYHAAVSAMKLLREDDIEKILCALEEKCGLNPALEERVFMDWDEVRAMRASGLVRFGSHTETHRILTTLSEDEITVELKGSKERLVEAGVVSPESVPFAYPNGNYTKRIAKLVRDAGYRLAVTTEKGWNPACADPELFQLKRIGVHEDVTSTDAMFCCRLAEIF